MLATSWNAAGFVEKAWKRLEPPTRDRLAELTGITATNLSGYNTGRLPMTRDKAQRICAVVEGLTPADLGATEWPLPPTHEPNFLQRLEQVEGGLRRLGDDLQRLSELDLPRRVRVLEQQAQARKRPGGSQKGQAGQ